MIHLDHWGGFFLPRSLSARTWTRSIWKKISWPAESKIHASKWETSWKPTWASEPGLVATWAEPSLVRVLCQLANWGYFIEKTNENQRKFTVFISICLFVDFLLLIGKPLENLLVFVGFIFTASWLTFLTTQARLYSFGMTAILTAFSWRMASSFGPRRIPTISFA